MPLQRAPAKSVIANPKKLVIAALLLFAVVLVAIMHGNSPIPGASSILNDDKLQTEKKVGNIVRPIRTVAPNTNGVNSKEAELEFGDGHWESVVWRGMDETYRAMPPYGDKYEELYEEAAAGDPHASYALFRVLEYCNEVSESREDLKSTVAAIRSTMTVKSEADGVAIPFPNTEYMERYIERLESTFENCHPISKEMTSQSGEWLERSVDGGSTEAVIYYALSIDDTDRAFDFLESAWALGSISSLRAMRNIHWHNYKAGLDSDANTKAFAAQYAFATLAEQATLSYGNDAAGVVMSHKSRLEEIGSTMTDDQIEKAIVIALNRIRTNSNCCYTN